MRSGRNRRRPRVTVLVWLLFGVIAGLTACGAGGGEAPSGLPSTRTTQRDAERPPSGEPGTPRPERTTEPAEPTRAPEATEATPERTRTTRSTEPAQTTTRPPTVAEPAPARTTQTTEPARAARTTEPVRTTGATEPARTTTPAEQTPTPAASASAVATSGTAGGLGFFGWLLMLVLLAALIVAGVLVARSQRRSGWDTEARALESETRAISATRLPPVLRTTTTGRRALAWPPVRAELVEVQNRWGALADRASGDARRNWSLRVTALLHELITAVDIEGEALGTGQDWRPLRVRVEQVDRALTSVLSGQPQPEPPAAEPGTSAYQT
ncbi:hypothetical protein ACPCHT_08730 [Nucisporomicrobium flavum]|uniref:hypothetical protein n=1 Tax=Nucisporomicrobium flavum TaxID=2785915 RepID=UPI0018F6FF9B|nr:hypothetical protein [Nucisporomicrobium flavum]